MNSTLDISTHPTPVGTAARSGRRYVVISPCRDESTLLATTIETVLRQTERPELWVIVNDGSRDGSGAMLDEYAARHDWIRVLHRPDRGKRVLGSGVMEAFYHGLDQVDLSDFDYLCKLDLDLDLPERYFATLMDHMEADPRLGCCSGKPYFTRDGQVFSERCGDEHAVGMSKFYRVNAFRQIGGFVRELMWDGIDTHCCRMLGWRAASWDADDLRFIHLRPMGSSDKSWLTGRLRHGRGQHFMGTHPIYMLASAAWRIFHPPLLIGSAGMLWGYVRARLKREPTFDRPGFRQFLRSYQMACLRKGKRAATADLETEQAAAWKPAFRP
jgi:poly-beta-1,6-N-acetyl-D-glucosamine synthase